MSAESNDVAEAIKRSLVDRLRGPHRRSECGNFAEVHPGFLNEAADRISTLERELEEARASVAALMSERSSLIATKAEQLVALTKRATAAEAKVARMGEGGE